MATNRVTMQDAIADVSLRVARTNTALVRIGTVTAITGSQATVNVGGSSFAATLLSLVKVNDVCALLFDTDAWWVVGKIGGSVPPTPSYPWIDWSATFSIGASVTPPSKGNATYRAEYTRIGDVVHYGFSFVIGSTFAVGSGDYTIPVPITPTVNSIANAVGSLFVNDSGTAYRLGALVFTSASTLIMVREGGFVIGSAGPGTAWSPNDEIRASITYRTG